MWSRIFWDMYPMELTQDASNYQILCRLLNIVNKQAAEIADLQTRVKALETKTVNNLPLQLSVQNGKITSV